MEPFWHPNSRWQPSGDQDAANMGDSSVAKAIGTYSVELETRKKNTLPSSEVVASRRAEAVRDIVVTTP